MLEVGKADAPLPFGARWQCGCMRRYIEDTAEAEADIEAEAESTGNFMLTWRKLRNDEDFEGMSECKLRDDEDFEDMNGCKLRDDEVCELCEGMNEFNVKVDEVRDMFAGGHRNAQSIEIEVMRAKMTPVMQLTDVGVAFNLKK